MGTPLSLRILSLSLTLDWFENVSQRHIFLETVPVCAVVRNFDLRRKQGVVLSTPHDGNAPLRACMSRYNFYQTRHQLNMAPSPAFQHYLNREDEFPRLRSRLRTGNS